MAGPATQNLTIYQGQDWGAELRFWQDEGKTVPMDLTGYAIDMHVRDKPAAALDPTVDVVLTSRTGTDEAGAGRITFDENSDGEPDPTTGRILLALTAEETAAIPFIGRARTLPATCTYFYDLELTDAAGRVVRVLRGEITLDAEITKRT